MRQGQSLCPTITLYYICIYEIFNFAKKMTKLHTYIKCPDTYDLIMALVT